MKTRIAKIEAVIGEFRERFAAVDRQFDQVDQRFDQVDGPVQIFLPPLP